MRSAFTRAILDGRQITLARTKIILTGVTTQKMKSAYSPHNWSVFHEYMIL